MNAFFVRDLVRIVEPLAPEDRISQALERMRREFLPSIPVTEQGRVVGIISEDDLLPLFPQFFPNPDVLNQVQMGTLFQVMSAPAVTCREDAPLTEAAQLFHLHHLRILPVTGPDGIYRGILTRADVMALLGEAVRPYSVGGMATPLGVYLTTGHLRAGAGDIGLFLTGVVLALVFILCEAILMGLERIFAIEFRSTLPGVLLEFLLFLLLIKYSPLAGFHGGEHKTVHAIEKGKPLVPELVMVEPKEHPRCGTNIMALLIGIQILSYAIPIYLAIILVFLVWRSLGHYLQKFFTTMEPSQKQLQSALDAGEKLLAKYYATPGYRAGFLGRIWNMGILQVILGGATVELLYYLALKSMGLQGLFFS